MPPLMTFQKAHWYMFTCMEARTDTYYNHIVPLVNKEEIPLPLINTIKTTLSSDGNPNRVVIINVIYLGHMTEESFTKGPKAVSVQ